MFPIPITDDDAAHCPIYPFTFVSPLKWRPDQAPVNWHLQGTVKVKHRTDWPLLETATELESTDLRSHLGLEI